MPVYANAGAPHPELYPYWVVRRVGIPLLLEADWPEASMGAKYGIVSSGDGASVNRDYAHFFGGLGSCVLTTGDALGDTAGIQIMHPFVTAGLVALEHRWIPDASVDWDFGFEWSLRGRMRYVGAAGEWQYESDPGVFSSFAAPVMVAKPRIATTGDHWGWARLVIDLESEQYVSFEAAGQDRRYYYRDLGGMRLVDPGLGVGPFDIKAFGTATTRTAANETSYTTDWCVSKLD